MTSARMVGNEDIILSIASKCVFQAQNVKMDSGWGFAPYPTERLYSMQTLSLD